MNRFFTLLLAASCLTAVGQEESFGINGTDLEIKQIKTAHLAQNDELIVIPVVFHIIHANGPENIAVLQVLSALENLNLHMSGEDPDIAEVVPEFVDLIADSRIEFRLATRDPLGNCHPGINRVESDLTFAGDSEMKQLIQWPPNKYLNVWVCEYASGAVAYTQYPQWVQGSPEEDGIVIQHSYTGSIGTSNAYRSRILTRYVGSWLNLRPTWGNSNNPGLDENCDEDDLVADTPNTIGWTSCDLDGATCGSLDNVQNYMDFSFCGRMFTLGQKNRMRAAALSSVAQRNELSTISNLQATGVDVVGFENECFCTGIIDECGICDGPGPSGECGCFAIPEGDCDCNGNQFDAVGTCGGGCTSDINNNGVCDDQEVPGCTYAFAENYNPDATDDDGSCTVAECDPLEEDGCNLEGDLNGDGFVGTSDLLDFLTQFGAECTPETAFTCGNPVSYQGYDYQTVQIGEQCWFAENLRATQYSNGSNIPVALDCALGGTEWGVLFTPAQTVFGSSGGALMGTCIPCNHFNPDFNACNPDLSLSEYGVLYNWYAVNAPGELCPSGWQVPNKAQWEELRDYVLGQGYAEVNTPLRSTGGWIENDNGTDVFGFSGRSGGKRHPNGSFQAAGKIGLWWSRTASGLEAYRFRLDSDNSGQTINTEDWRNGFSVRCIKD